MVTVVYSGSHLHPSSCCGLSLLSRDLSAMHDTSTHSTHREPMVSSTHMESHSWSVSYSLEGGTAKQNDGSEEDTPFEAELS